MKRALVCTIMLSLAAPAVSQTGYGIRTTPPQSKRPSARPGYEGSYDRADAGWQSERHNCLYGRASSKATRRACNDTLRNRQPLSSDFVKAPAVK